MNREFDLQKQNICEGCGGIPGDKCSECVECLSFLTAFQTSPDKAPNNPVAVVGSGSAYEAHDVQPTQGFKVSSSVPICDNCHQQEGSNPACDLCATLKKTQEEAHPFTKKQVEELHAKMKSGFSPPPTGRMFELVVLLFSLLIASIDWTMHNCAFSTLVLMLSSSNVGLNSINQQTFAGYILADIIKRLQETGKCDPLLLEVFRLELSIISGNSAWSNWSELVEFQELYKVCVRHNIILDNEVEFVLPDDDGSYNVRQPLTGKRGSTLIGAFKWNPSGNVLANGIFSSDFNSRYKISAVILFHNDHFSIILFSQGIWLIDGKGKRTGMFKAESSIRELTIEESLELCASHGAFYFLEEIPFVYETLNLFGRQGLPPIKVSYGEKWYFLYDDGTMVCETTRTIVKLQRTVFMTDDRGNHFRVFPALQPPPTASSVSGQWVPPSPPPASSASSPWALPPPPQASYVSDQWVHPTPPPASSASGPWALLPPPQASCVSGPSVHPPPPQASCVSGPSLSQQPVHCSNELIRFYRSSMVGIYDDESNKKREFTPIQIAIGKNPTFLLSAERHQDNYVVDGKKYTYQEFFDYVHREYIQFLI